MKNNNGISVVYFPLIRLCSPSQLWHYREVIKTIQPKNEFIEKTYGYFGDTAPPKKESTNCIKFPGYS